jgi:hypothetical protein
MIVYFSLRFIVKYFNVIVLLESSNILCNHLRTLTTSTSSWSRPSNGSMEGEINYYYYYYYRPQSSHTINLIVHQAL